jgi:hypothetical protein
MKNKIFGLSLLTLLVFVGCGGGGSSGLDLATVQLREDVRLIEEPAKEVIKKEITQNSKNLIISKKTANRLKKGEVFYISTDEDSRFPLGFSGRVEDMTTLANGDSKVEFSEVGIFDIMEKSKQENMKVELNEENFIGVIAPSYVSSSLTKQQKLSQKSSKSFLDGGVRFVSEKGSNNKEKSFLGDDGRVSWNDIELNLDVSLKDVLPTATSIKPYGNSGEAKIKVSGLFSNLILTEEHDWNYQPFEDNYLEFNTKLSGTMRAEVKLQGGVKGTLGFYNRTWREVEEDAFNKFGIKIDTGGLISDDKEGLIPIVGIVFKIPTVTSYVGPRITQTAVRSAKHGGAIFWVYANMKGEISLDGEVGVATNNSFKIGINKPRDKNFESITEIINNKNYRILEAPFLKGEVKTELTLGFSTALDVFFGGVRMANMSVSPICKRTDSLQSGDKRISYGINTRGSPWQWSEQFIPKTCGSGGGGLMFNAKTNFSLLGEVWKKDVEFHIKSWAMQYPLEEDIEKTESGWVKNSWWYVFNGKCKDITRTPIKGNITLPNTAGDLNFVFLSKDTKTAFVLTKNYIEGDLYLYSYDISNPKAINLLDTQFLAGSNIRYVYDGIYLSKDKNRLYTLITDHRYGDDRFFVVDISTPSSLNILGTKISEQKEDYFSYNLLSEIKGFSADETKVYFSSFVKEFASSEPQKDMLYLNISDLSNMNYYSGALNYTLAGHEPQSSTNGVTVTVQDKKLTVERK